MQPYRRVLHPIDLDHLSKPAFCHALKLALCGTGYPDGKEHALLELFHCESEKTAMFSDFPQVRERLTRWGVLPEGAAKQAVVDLGLSVRKQISRGNIEEEIALETEAREFELMVMSSQARAGWSYFLHRSISASALQNTHLPGLLLPGDVRGFIQAETGRVQLSKVMVPVAPSPEAWPALQAVARLLLTLKPSEAGEVMLVYVGREEDFPEQSQPSLPAGWGWSHKCLEGEPVAALSSWSRQWQPDLVALASAGQKNWRDRWFGSTAERLLTEIQCPALVAPSEET
ncbi:universal stress protein [bacterium]|nr:universal stress protein [bacterium]